MPDRIALRALAPLTYAGRAVAAGSYFLTTPIDAAALTYRRVAAYAVAADADEAQAKPRRYKRRDLQAET